MITKHPKNVTLLVHYSAPGTVKDDEKWKQIANSITSMKTIAAVRVMNLPEIESNTPTSYQRCQLRQTDSSHIDKSASTEGSDFGHSFVFPDDFGTHDTCVERAHNKRKRHINSERTKQHLFKRSCAGSRPSNIHLATVPATPSTFARTKQGFNPPFKNPVIASKSKTRRCCYCAQRRLTAPEATVLVPFSGTAQRRCWRSNSVLVSDELSSFEEHRQHSQYTTPIFTKSGKMVDSFLNDSMSRRSPPPSCNKLGDRSEYARVNHPSILISDATEQATGMRHDIHNTSGHFGSPVLTNIICSTGSNDMDRYLFRSSLPGYKSINLLPLRVECEVPIDQMDDVAAFSIPSHLDQLANNESLRRHFQPTIVERDIKTTERGYWKILVNVASPERVAASRLPPVSTSQSSDIQYLLRRQGKISRNTSKAKTDAMVKEMLYHDLPIALNMLWTEEEFLRVFEALSSFIKRGLAGWATRIVLLRGEQVDNEIGIELRLYTFGQIIAHMWLALSWLSEGLTDQMPLEWIGSDRRCIVRMASQMERYGDLGYWECKQEGKAGFWGIRRNSSPINVGCD